MEFPKDCRFTREHEWARNEDGVVVIGVTDYAQEKLGEIVYVELPSENDAIRKDEAFGVVESTKNASDVLAPLSGKVIEVNQILEENPELINNDPYEEGWIVKVQPDDLEELDDLMTADEYRDYCEKIENEEDEAE
jgi:glycine cleavage system H protein